MKFIVQERNTNKYCQFKIKKGYLGRLILASAKYNFKKSSIKSSNFHKKFRYPVLSSQQQYQYR